MRWYTIEEKLPEPYVSVLAYDPIEAPFPCVHESYVDNEGNWHTPWPGDMLHITHWMDMPPISLEVEE